MAKFNTLSGYTKRKDLTKYLIDWDGTTRSKFQSGVKAYLRPYWENYVCYEEMPVVGTRMTFDLVNMSKRLVIEVQGAQHSKANKFFHGKTGHKFLEQLDRDRQKVEWCKLNDFQLIEIYPENLPLTLDFFRTVYSISIV
jgi:hypothetical protein